jgi:hypothetical protein
MKETIILLLSAIIAGIGWLLRSEREKRRETEKQLSDKKYAVYSEIFSLLFEVVKGTKTNKQWDTEDVGERMLTIVQNLIVYGSDSVLQKFSNWKRYSGEIDGISAMVMFTDILTEIRKDMGHPETKMKLDTLWGMIITDYDTIQPTLKEAAMRHAPHLV